MAQVTLLPPFSTDFLGGREGLTVEAATIFALVRALDAMAPGFAARAEQGAAVAVGGAVIADWTTALTADDEVLFVPRIAGGSGG